MNLANDLEAIRMDQSDYRHNDNYQPPEESVPFQELMRALQASILRSVLIGFTAGAMVGACFTIIAVLMVRP